MHCTIIINEFKKQRKRSQQQTRVTTSSKEATKCISETDVTAAVCVTNIFNCTLPLVFRYSGPFQRRDSGVALKFRCAGSGSVGGFDP